MEIFDRLALWGRKYHRQTAGPSGRARFNLWDVLSAFDRNAILELTPYIGGRRGTTLRPDTKRKVKVSLLDDGISALSLHPDSWFEVYKTAPSGDVARARIVAYGPNDEPLGELRLLIGARSYEQYFQEDPIFDALDRASD
jgi:hypothetical protein